MNAFKRLLHQLLWRSRSVKPDTLFAWNPPEQPGRFKECIFISDNHGTGSNKFTHGELFSCTQLLYSTVYWANCVCEEYSCCDSEVNDLWELRAPHHGERNTCARLLGRWVWTWAWNKALDKRCNKHAANNHATKRRTSLQTSHSGLFSLSSLPFTSHPSVKRESCSRSAAAAPPLSRKSNFLTSAALRRVVARQKYAPFCSSLPDNKANSASEAQRVRLEVGAIYRSLVSRAWINAERAVDLEHFKHPEKNDDVGDGRGEDSLWRSEPICCAGLTELGHVVAAR